MSQAASGSPSVRRAALYTIPPDLPFADALALGLIEKTAGDPLALARVTVLLPTRRSVRTLREAFLRQSRGQALLLPSMRPIGDIEDDEAGFALDAGGDGLSLPEAISPLRRHLLLARLVMAARARPRGEPDVTGAIALARDLASLLDQVETERLGFEPLADLVPADFAAHWQITIEFLKIVTEAWPRILAEEGVLDPAVRRDRVLTALAERWSAEPPAGPVIAAGSTGSIPATAGLLAAIARLPEGALVLPGLDLDLDEASFEALSPTHPQFGMRALLQSIGASREDVKPWPLPASHALASCDPARLDLLREVMRPAEKAEAGREARLDLGRALSGVSRIEAPGRREEAAAVALIMRETLETPGKTAALVTPDRALARAVRAELDRFGVAVDDSAGAPLAETPPASFLRLTLRALHAGLAPAPLLALLKHPFASCGVERPRFLGLARTLEIAILRGSRPSPGFAGLRATLAAGREAAALLPWIERLEAALAPLEAALAAKSTGLAALAKAHIATAEALAATSAEDGAAILWAGEAGEAAATFLASLIEEGDCLPPLSGHHYPALFDALLAGQVIRPAHGAHPRLHIWGTLEARLQSADTVILGGLNEGVWPPETGADPWMSRPMRTRFGLSPPERRIGLAAQDFVTAAAAPAVVLSRAVKIEGAPATPSRWLFRLDALLDRAIPGAPALGWAAEIDRPERVVPARPPAPRPPIAARPRALSVTEVETWIQDPYSIYAKKILRLRPLDPLDADPGAADRGTIVHEALDRFLRDHKDALPEDAFARLLEAGREAFGAALSRPSVAAFWWPRFERIAAWWLETERTRRETARTLATEVTAEMTLEGPAGPFVLKAKADRIDRFHAGGLAVIDYKTGAPPKKRKLEAGYAPQLPLEAALARSGSFKGVPAEAVAELAFWRLSGADPVGKIEPLGKGEEARLADEALDRLLALIAAFDDPATAYLSQPRPAFAGYGEYDHLARVKEWRGREDKEER